MENTNTKYGIYDFIMLNAGSTEDDISAICDFAVANGGASVLVPQCYLPQAKTRLGKARISIATAIGYPNGSSVTDVKLLECKVGIKNGAEEYEVYPNLGYIKKRKYNEVLAELVSIRKVLKNKVVKLVLDANHLTVDEQIAICSITMSTQIDYIALISNKSVAEMAENVKRLKESCGNTTKIKVFCAINSSNDLGRLVSMGVERVSSFDYALINISETEEETAQPAYVSEEEESVDSE